MSIGSRILRKLPALTIPLVLMAGTGLARGGVIAHWTFDELSGADHDTFVDSGGKPNRDGAKLNALLADKNQVTLDSSGNVPFGKAARFSGRSGAFLDLPYINGIHDHSFSIAVWVNLSTNDRSYVLADWAAPNFSFAFGFDPGKNVLAPHISAMMRNDVFKVNRQKVRSNTDIVTFRNDSMVGLNTWHHAVWTWDRPDDKHGTLSAYLDGVKVATTGQAARLTTVNTMDNRHPMKIGFKQDTDSTFHGAMDELWIFDTALTDAQVTNLMKTNDIATVQLAAAPVAVAPTPPPVTPAAPVAAPVVRPDATPAPNTTPTPPVDSVPTAVAAAPENAVSPAPAAVTPSDPNVTPVPTANNTASPSVSAPVAAAAPSEPEGPDFLHATAPRDGSVPATVLPTLSTIHPAHRYTSGRLAGIFTTGLIALGLSWFLVWANNERARMRHARH